ncbi:MAG TPA: 16S rRNA (adenine(1518)-N(6)/adenine(1519)-N(6))-dimethyltransferase RsmA [Patescibacteria group bacterium]|nr:16S rRNA (adenine(1518)-N(6)/adenine(1519)-N(6))-dimethyltransferase RsmA [Patescibacteria group bacterium]
MDLTSKDVIQKLCRAYNIRPLRECGQNFLISRDVLDDMVEAADLKKDDIILEVGPGFGTLTLELAKRVKKVIAVEQDEILINTLQENLKKENINNVEIIEGSVLKLPTTRYQLLTANYRIVANLPYQITSRFLRQFLAEENKPQDMMLMVQKEVAERICAKPGQMSLLAVSVQFYAKPEIVRVVSKDCFWPEPKVDSAILKIVLKTKEEITRILSANVIASGAKQSSEIAAPRKAGLAMTEVDFFKIVRNGFLHRRQKLVNNLSNAFRLDKNILQLQLKEMEIFENARAQELSMNQWIDLTKEILKLKGDKLRLTE